MNHDPQRPAGPDDDLGRALSAGLSRATGGGVDTDALVAGARAGARRIRRRRTAVRGTVAALCVAAVLPLGVNLFGSTSVMTASDSAAGGAAPAAAPEAMSSAAADGPETLYNAEEGVGGDGAGGSSPSVPRRATATDQGDRASAKAGLVQRDGAGLVIVPDDAVLTADDLGTAPVTLAQDVPGTDAATTVVTLCAGGLPGDAQVVGGRSLRWDGPADDGRAWSFSTVVRVFAGDGATAQLDALRRSVGTCDGSVGASREPVGGLPGDDALLTVLPDDGTGDVRAVGVVRLGRTTAGVLVVVPSTVGTDDAARRALAVERTRTLLGRAAERLGPFAATAAADPALG